MGFATDDQVEVLAPICTPAVLEKAAAAGIDLAAIEAALLAVAVAGPHRDLQKAVGAYLAALDPDGPEPDPTEGRSLTMSRLLGGTYSGTFVLDAVGGEKVATAIESIEQGRQYSPEFQQQLRRGAREFTLKEGETVTVDLKLTPDL